MKGTIKVLNSRGHTAVEFDTEAGIVERAETVLREAHYHGATLFSGETKEQIAAAHSGMMGDKEQRRKILEENEDIIVVPPMAGG